MDIRNWPDGQIMQLPDSAFGRRWAIIFNGFTDCSADEFFISECALPDKCVLWELWTYQQTYYDVTGSKFVGYGQMGLRLGDQLPAAVAEFRAYESMFPCTGTVNNILYWPIHLMQLKTLYHAQGRRVVLWRLNAESVFSNWTVGLVFSSVPTEVPDCLVSA